MFRAKCEANQELGNRRRLHTPMRRSSTPIVQPRRFDARAGGSERQVRNAVHHRGAGRTGRYVVVRLLRSFFRLRRRCAAANGETSRSGCRGKGQPRRRMANRCARHEHPYVCMEKFALTNLINTNKPKERPWSLANGIRQRHAWKRRDGSCWPEADDSGRVQSVWLTGALRTCHSLIGTGPMKSFR
jgi:hypothetical protein